MTNKPTQSPEKYRLYGLLSVGGAFVCIIFFYAIK